MSEEFKGYTEEELRRRAARYQREVDAYWKEEHRKAQEEYREKEREAKRRKLVKPNEEK